MMVLQSLQDPNHRPFERIAIPGLTLVISQKSQSRI
jgi:hypothetical protein